MRSYCISLWCHGARIKAFFCQYYQPDRSSEQPPGCPVFTAMAQVYHCTGMFVRSGLAGLQVGPGRELFGLFSFGWELRRWIEGGERGVERLLPRAIWSLLHISQKLCFPFWSCPPRSNFHEGFFFSFHLWGCVCACMCALVSFCFDF